VNNPDAETSTLEERRLPAPDPEKTNSACVTSRVLENPLTITVIWPWSLLVNDTLVMVGADAAITRVMGVSPAGVTSTPPAVKASVTVMVPATVPVCSATCGVAVEFAGTVLRVQVPDSGWKRELQGLAPRYLAQINRYAGQKVVRIEFVIRQS